MRRILITGGLGYLGGHISQQLLHNNYIIIYYGIITVK